MYLRICVCSCWLWWCRGLFTRHSRKPQQHLHRNERRHGACVLHRCRKHKADVGVEVLLVMGGQAQALEPSAFGIALSLLHQSPTVSLTPLRLGHHHRLHKQAAAVTYDPRQPGVAQQPLCLFVALQENQADGELRAGFLQGVNTGGLTPLPLRVDQVSAGDQQVGTPVYRHHMDLPRLFRVCV